MEKVGVLLALLKAMLAVAIVLVSTLYLEIITDWKERDIKIGLIIAVVCAIILLITIIVLIQMPRCCNWQPSQT